MGASLRDSSRGKRERLVAEMHAFRNKIRDGRILIISLMVPFLLRPLPDGYPVEAATEIALETVRKILDNEEYDSVSSSSSISV